MFGLGEGNRAIREVLDRLDTVERQLRKLDAEFSDLLDRVNRQVARLVKREERERDRAEEARPHDDPAQRGMPTTMEAARAILASRRGNGGALR